MANKQIGAKGIAIIKAMEGFSATPYHNPGEPWLTIGYGHHAPDVTPGMRLSRAEGEKLLVKDLTRFVSAVNRYVKVSVNQDQFDTMVSLCYNMGEGGFAGTRVLRFTNQRNYAAAAEAFMDITNGGLAGLVRRRKIERQVYIDGTIIDAQVRDELKNTSGSIGGDDGGGSEFRTMVENHIKKNKVTRPALKLKGIKGIVIHEIRTNNTAKAYQKSLNSGNSTSGMGYHVIVDGVEAINTVPFTEGVSHADKGKRLISALGNPDLSTISIGMISNQNNTFSDKTLVNAIMACSEILNIYKLPAKNIYYGAIVDGTPEPVSWVNNTFLYSSFMSLAEAAKESGKEVITNPGYENGESGSSGGGTGLIPNGKGMIPKLIKYALQYEGKIKYILGNRDIRIGGTGDCAAYTKHCFLNVTGRDYGVTTWTQIEFGKSISVSEARAGDMVFFDGGGAPPSHVGIVIGKDKMINLQNNGCIVESISSWTSYGAPARWARRYFSDSEYEEAFEKPKPAKPVIDVKKPYVVNIKSPEVASNKPSGGVTVKRVVSGEKYRALSINSSSVQIEENVWIPKSSPAISFSPLKSAKENIGYVETKLPVRVFSAPSLRSDAVRKGGTELVHPQKTTVPIFAVQNGMARISIEEEEWITSSSAYSSVFFDNVEEYAYTIDFNEGAEVFTTMGSNGYVDSYTTEDNTVIKEGMKAIAANEMLLPIGSILEIKVPSRPEYNGRYIVASNIPSSFDPNQLEIYLPTTESFNFGTRNVQAFLVDQIPREEVDIYLEKSILDEGEEEFE